MLPLGLLLRGRSGLVQTTRQLSCAARGFAKVPDNEAPYEGHKGEEVGKHKKGDELVKQENLEFKTITVPGAAYQGDLRSTSGLGLGDGLHTHTSKWLQVDGHYSGNLKSPMEWIQESEPIKVHGAVVASYGSDNPALGCPVEYISLKGTSRENPAVCKYTGNKYYSDDWHKHH